MTSGRSSHLSCEVEVMTVSPLKGWCEDYINCFIYILCVGPVWALVVPDAAVVLVVIPKSKDKPIVRLMYLGR